MRYALVGPRRQLSKVGSFLALGLFLSCTDNVVGPPATAATHVDQYVEALPAWSVFSPMQPEATEQTGEARTVEEIVDGARYRCTTTPYSVTRNPERIVTLDPDANVMWPGVLIQGRGYAKGPGSLLELPIRERAPLDISIDLLTGSNTTRVELPTLASVNSAVGRLIEEAERSGHRAGSSISYALEDTWSVDQALLGLGLTIRTVPFSVRAQLSTDQSASSHTVTAYFVQRMFTVSVALPDQPSGFFSEALTPATLQAHVNRGVIGPDNLPVYVANIVYGRILLFSMTSDSSASMIRAAIHASAGKDSAVAGTLSDTTLAVLRNSTLNIVTIGGDGNNALALIQSGNLNDYFKTDAPLTSARPISYTLRNLADNTIATVSEMTEYNLTECAPVNVLGALSVNVTPNHASVQVVGSGGYSSGWIVGDQVIGELAPGGYTVIAAMRDSDGTIDPAYTRDTVQVDVWGGDTTWVNAGVVPTATVGSLYRVTLESFKVTDGACAGAVTEGDLEGHYDAWIRATDGTQAGIQDGTFSLAPPYQMTTPTALDLSADRAAFLSGAEPLTVEFYFHVWEKDAGTWLDEHDQMGEIHQVLRYPGVWEGTRTLNLGKNSCRVELTVTIENRGPAARP